MNVNHDNSEIFCLCLQLPKSQIVQNFFLKAEIKAKHFSQSVEVITISKLYTITIQTDKLVYKPGDEVKYRVLVVNFNMKLHKIRKLRIEIWDDLRNVFKDKRIGEIKRKPILPLGVHTSSFNIPDDAVKGTWRMKVTVNDEDDRAVTKSFEINQYVLPRFEMFCDTSSDVMQSDKIISLKVYATYTFDENVEGTVKVVAKVYDTKLIDKVMHTMTKTQHVNFVEFIEFDIKNDLMIKFSVRTFVVKFEIEFTENLTGQTRSKTVNVRVHKVAKHTVKIIGERQMFKPGFPYNIRTTIKKGDSFFEEYQGDKVKLNVVFYTKPLICELVSKGKKGTEEIRQTFFSELVNGVAELTIDVPDNSTAFSVSAVYGSAIDKINVKRDLSKTQEYLVIKTSTARYDVNKFSRNVFSSINFQQTKSWNTIHC